ncbi:MAG: FG-GAP-like repeat-containing protein [Terracidiphilus sp.]
MSHRPQLSVIRSARLSLGVEPKRLARIERNIPRHCQQTLARKPLSAVFFAMIGLVLASSFLVQLPLLQAQVPSQKPAQPRHRQGKPMLTGIDGAQTGIASFLGNFTTISTPSGALSVFRKPNCSLSLATGNYVLDPFTYTQTELASNYELLLHKEAQLTTTPDVFASGCAIQPSAGFGSQPGIFVGTTTTGVNVFAGIGLVAPAFVEGVYLLTGKSTFSLSSFQYSSVGNLTAADLNKDGNGDLVITENPLAPSARVTVMLGKSDGTFENAVFYPIAGNYSVAAVIDDVNGDGNLDIVAVSGDQQISVLLGNGDGTFQAAKSIAAPALPGYASASDTQITNLITADLRGNGKRDVICSNGLILLSNGDGTFTPVSAPAFPYYQDPLSNYGVNLASGDINKDGKIDLVINNSSTISTWIGNGDGTFTQGQSYATIATDGFISVDDLDGDGNPDVFVGLGDGGAFGGDEGSPNLSYALMGNGNGTFQGAPKIGFGAYTGNNLADVTGSGKLDLITNTVDTPYGYPDTLVPTFTVQFSNGKGLFNPVSTITPPASFVLKGTTITSATTAGASTFAVGDINGDGKADLVFADNGLYGVYGGGFDSGLPVYFTAISNGDGTFPTPTPHAFPQIAAAGKVDVELTVSGLQISNFRKGGNAGLIFTFNDVAGGTVAPIYSMGFVALPGNGDGTFQAPVITTTLSSATALNANTQPVIAAVADVNNDGNPDLVIINNTYANNVFLESQVEVFLGNGDGTFKAPILVNTPANPTAIVVADFNKDGKLDIATVCGAINAAVDQLAISLGNGDGTFAAPTLMSIASDVNGGATLAAADFNADGNVDLALFNPFGYSGIFYGDGNGTFTSVNTGSYVVPKDLLNLPASGAAVAVDLNGDGKPDILVGNTILLSLYGSAPNTNPPVNSGTALTASSQTITAGASVKFTATVTGPSGDATVPTGTVTFYNGATSIGTGTLNASGVATYTTTTLPTGSESITAVYGGDANFNGSTSAAVVVTVNPVVATTTVLTASPTSALTGVSIGLTATVTPASGAVAPTGTVTFYDGATSIGSGALDASGVGTLSTTTLAAGSHSITAAYGGSPAFVASTSAAVTVTITAPPPDFMLAISPTSGTETSTAPAAATLTVTPVNSFNGTVNFACSGLPSYIACGFSPSTLTPAGAALKTTVTFADSASARVQPAPGAKPSPLICLAFGFGFLLLARARKYRTLFRASAVLLFALAIVNIAACGSAKATPQTNTVTITATSGALSHATTYTLTSTK